MDHIREYVYYIFFKIQKNAFFCLRFLNDVKKHRKRYQVYHIARTLAYIVRSEINTYIQLYIQHYIQELSYRKQIMHQLHKH